MKRAGFQVSLIGDSDADATTVAVAFEIGAMLAELGAILITGGGAGTMQAACRGARSKGGVTVAILKSADFADANDASSIVIPTGLGHARNVVNILAGDVVIALGSSAGTISEACFAWIQGRPILTLAGFGGWVERVAREGGVDGRRTSEVIVVDSVSELRDEIARRMAARQ
ncbi:MAG TPA: TIGR00725 family protein [Tepidisphaeraceae bacterium]|jgi:hypothetical protein